MKVSIFIVLMFGFLTGNAQQDRQQYNPNNAGESAQLYYDIDPGHPVFGDLNRNKIRKADNLTGFPVLFDRNRYTIRGIDNEELPVVVDVNRNQNRITDSQPGYPVIIDLNRYSNRKTY